MKKLKALLITALALVSVFPLYACGVNRDPALEPGEYTIQYTDNTGIHTIGVETGKLYALTSLPEKNGYEFIGLYDAEVGGTQYVNSGGSAVSAFTDNKNIVLYPQFKAKEYTLVLDYQGAAVTGSRSLTVGYNSLISGLPINLVMENKTFAGWYTEPNKHGVQVADKYGEIPSKNIVDESIFDLSDPKGYIFLYAGFKGEEYTVTFYFAENGSPEEVKVEYGTPISQVQLETRVDGKAVIAWSKKRNDTDKEQIFDGKVTGEMVLYAAEYAPVIDFDSNGGNKINSVIARAGDGIALPTPVRENYKFMGWQTAGGSTFNSTSMPTDSIKLTAKWQAMIIFDVNGGTEVKNISAAQGTRITLPETEKADYMFAGWYQGNGEKYTNTAMPNVSVKLYAKYWKVQKETRVIIDDTNGYGFDAKYGSRNVPDISFCSKELDFSELYAKNIRDVNISLSYKCYAKVYTGTTISSSAPCYTCMSWYSTNVATNAYKVWEYKDKHIDNNYISCRQSTNLKLTTDKIYICFYFNSDYGSKYSCTWKDFYIEIEYPDMSTLY